MCMWCRPALELSERGLGSNSQGSIAGPSTDSSPSSADDPASNLQQVNPAGSGGHHHQTSTAVNDSGHAVNNVNSGGAPNSGRNSQRRRSTRHQNYLNRSQLHQAVELPDGYGVYSLQMSCVTYHSDLVKPIRFCVIDFWAVSFDSVNIQFYEKFYNQVSFGYK